MFDYAMSAVFVGNKYFLLLLFYCFTVTNYSFTYPVVTLVLRIQYNCPVIFKPIYTTPKEELCWNFRTIYGG